MSIYLIFLLLVPGILTAQNVQQKLIKAGDFQPGFYLSFEEFKINKPSIEKDSFLRILSGLDDNRVNIFNEYKQFKNISFSDLEEDNLLKRYLYLQLLKTTDSLKNIWGYNDGNNIYLFHKKQLERVDYYKVTFIGRYCIAEKVYVESNGYGEKMLNPDKTIKSSVISDVIIDTDIRLVDYNTGDILELNKYILLQILNNDDILKNKFLKDKNKNKDLSSYLIEYDLRPGRLAG